MSDYTQVTAFTPKDSLVSGNPAKVIKGSEFDAEFAAISTSLQTKADKTGASFTGNVSTTGNLSASGTLTVAGDSSLEDVAYTGTLTGGTGVVNLGSGQFVKDAAGNVGVGTSSPEAALDVVRSGVSQVTIRNTSGTTKNTQLIYADSGGNKWQVGMDVATNNGSTAMQWYYAPTATSHLNLDSAGNLGLGVTPSAWNFNVKALHVNKAAFANNSNTTFLTSNAYYDSSYNPIYTATGAPAGALKFNPTGTGGMSIDLAPSGTVGNAVTFTTAMTLDASGNLTPGTDNTQTNGSGAKRWSVIYAGTGTINTSDAREKTAVRSMAADEIEAAKALSKEIGVYQFIDSVAIKGDKARHHIGMTVQRAIEIMEAHGLNPFAYGFVCYDKWDEKVTEHPAIEARAAVEAKAAVLDDNGNVIEPAVEAQPAVEAKAAWTEVTLKAGDRYSFRYDQLTLFIARGIHARLEALEAKA